jgi:transcriptional regulator with XRE-family HTH domain
MPTRVEAVLKRIRSWCKKRGLKQKDLAQLLDLTPQGLTEIFKGRARPTAETVLRMLEFMNEWKR